MGQVRYSVTLSSKLDVDLVEISNDLGVSKAEVFRRALMLFKHASAVDKVELTNKDEKQTVLLR